MSLDEGSIRQRIAKLLEESKEPLTADEIARIFDIDINDVYIHLEHIAKSIKRLYSGKKVLLMTTPRCRKCGYIFKIEKPKKPSRCPKCKSELIEPPQFIISSID